MIRQKEPSKINIDKLIDKANNGGLTQREQLQVLNELKARPYRFTISEELTKPIYLYDKNFKTIKKLILELDNGTNIMMELKRSKTIVNSY